MQVIVVCCACILCSGTQHPPGRKLWTAGRHCNTVHTCFGSVPGITSVIYINREP